MEATGELSIEKANFSGSMTNVVGFPDGDAWQNCESAYPGIDTTPNNPSNQNNRNNPNNPTGNTSITFENHTYTPIVITLAGETQTTFSEQKVSFQGKGGSQVPFNALTSGKTSSGGIVGLEMT